MSPVLPFTARLGSTGAEVVALQHLLNGLGAGLVVDGLFGPKTEEAVVSFQASVGLYADGIVGPRTQEALVIALRHHPALVARPAGERPNHPSSKEEGRSVVRVAADKYRDGYGSIRLRDDVAEAYERVRDEVRRRGGIVTSSGGLRSLGAKVGPNRSATSLHYLGRALDLFVYSAKVDPQTDPYVVVSDSDTDRAWVVWARVEDGEALELEAMTWKREVVRTVGTFVNLTELFRAEGFERIRARPSFWPPRNVNGASEWWHFQWETGLVKGESTLGDELLQIYELEEVMDTPPWAHRDAVWGEDWR